MSVTNTPLHTLVMKVDLPTAASPANTTLYVRSGGPVASRSAICVGELVSIGGAGAGEDDLTAARGLKRGDARGDGAGDGRTDLGSSTYWSVVVCRREKMAAEY